ncbi:unnamed protein product [Ceutorhynchus assimilis]|uniref:NADP-dependent oxidoreductase domain-containing protein n=1 Tax=Ceutorhynchus assimilis TaxID=467358 RepID=A0A9N9MQL7_9CUCU|nr:unnamed protein product [Ceutorhynchus assimilis]
MAAETFLLPNGQKIPMLGLGTWLSPPGKCAQTVKYAIEVGYRHIDAAWLYGNEMEVGEGVRKAIEEGIVKREDLFITTKLWNTFHEKDDVLPALKKSLENFGLSYVDLFLMHWPVACKNTGTFDIQLPFKDAVYYDHDFCETWKAMEECVDLGLVKSLGVSNFTSKQLQRIIDIARVKPTINQIEVTPLLNQKKLIAFCKEKDIYVTAYSPFGSPARPWRKDGEPVLNLQDPRLVGIGKQYNKNGAQVVLRYLIQLGTFPIPKSANPARIQENIDIFDFELSKEDMKVLDGFNKDFRCVHAEELMESNEYPFKDCEF